MDDTPAAPSEQPSPVIWLIRFALPAIIAYLFARSSQLRGSLLGIAIALSFITPLAFSWLLTVTENVSEPYLDEIFHIPQAQVYCQGRYLEWDDKITTPPGLYFSTIALNQLLGLSCSFYNLRAFNVFVISCISALVIICKARVAPTQTHSKSEANGHPVSAREILTGINVAFFPVLFFFSGLYYTDPASTLVVLLAYANHLGRVAAERERKGVSFLNDIYSLILGILALGFRQTNIFWVVVYMGGLEAIHSIKTLRPAPVETPAFRTISDRLRFYAWRYSVGDIHDPPLSLAYPVDAAICVIGIGIAAVCNLPTVLRRFIWPHGIVLAAFVAFVAWNGGVVLGDKSNHVATLHLAQMLYIWPFFAFFSAPLFVPQMVRLATTAYQVLTSKTSKEQPSLAGPDDSRRVPSASFTHPVFTALIGGGASAAALLVVRFNTIIHPFTLADNRHYVFYVFRYSILRAWWVRYALAPVYIACAWMCWRALQHQEEGDSPSDASSNDGNSTQSQHQWIRSPFRADSSTTTSRNATDSKAAAGASATPTDRQHIDSKTDTKVSLPLPLPLSIPLPRPLASPPMSTVLVLLLTTALSLMTAPLVEPRYFILPWVFWRLLVPAPTVSLGLPSPSGARLSKRPNKGNSGSDSGRSSGDNSIYVLLLETAWFALINAATMYVFVTRPFYWRMPDGTLLDEGRVQRFMW